jgi:RNA polymerase sigma factor for flagellar operon FliA
MAHPRRRSPNRNLPADTPEIVAVWRRYRASGRQADLDALARHYLPLLAFHASRVRRRGQSRVGFADLIGAGHVALTEALQAFEPGRGADFAAFSWKRLRRAMWDELALLLGETDRRRRQRKAASIAEAVLCQQLGRAPTPEELAERVGDSPWLWEVDRLGPPSTAAAALAEPERPSLFAMEHAAAHATPAPIDRMLRQEERRHWQRGMDAVDRSIFRRFFFAGEGIKTIAAAVSRHRAVVSKRFRRMVARLRASVPLARYLGVRYDPARATLSSRQNRAA